MNGPVPARLQPFHRIIGVHLAARGSRSDDFEHDPTHHAPRYVVRMAEALLSAINERATTSVTLARFLLIETTASGHVDYHRKLALYCSELVQPVSPGIPA